jgi:hypothetical protein
VHFWDLGPDQQAFWMRHEFARYFLFLGDDSQYDTGQGVQAWDAYIDWLNEKYEDYYANRE